MARNYYYFVAGLPDILLDEGRQQAACIEFASEAQEQLSATDFDRFNLLRLPFDNANLVNVHKVGIICSGFRSIMPTL